MSDRLYLCAVCLDTGVITRKRYRSDGVCLGLFGSPCQDCEGGDRQRKDWTDNGLRRAGEENARLIERIERLMRTDDPEAESERWRSAARARQDKRKDEHEAGFKPINAITPDIPF